MARAEQSTVRNRLLRYMDPEDFGEIVGDLHHVDLPKGTRLYEHGDRVRHAWFIEDGLGSVIAHLPDGDAAEIGLYGFEGLAGIPALLGDDIAEHTLTMQIGGRGYRIGAEQIRESMRQRPKLNALLLRYIQYFLIQVGQTAVSNARCSIEQRLGRWLLMSHDRIANDDVPLTHEYLAMMLAVRRSSVTVAIHELEGRGLIRGRRGSIEIRDRRGLEQFASDVYGIPERTFERLVGPLT